jgi:hypothetical protein
MSYDPTLPVDHAKVIAAELRGQFAGLKTLIDAVPPGVVGPPGPVGAAGLAVSGVADNGAGQAIIQMSDGSTFGLFSVASGPQGPQGNNGTAGRSVVNVYDDGSGRCVIQMSDGTNYGPFTIATGPQGMQGAQGPQGNNGNDGAQGPQGFNGNNGNDGAPGPQGPQGNPGEVSTMDLNSALASALFGTSANSNGVATLDTPLTDPDMETLRQKLNELIAALRR